MKKHRNPRNESPVRIPRLSSPHNSAPRQFSIHSNPHNGMALSFDVIEPVPLEIRYPSHTEDKPLRRSSRFTSSKHEAAILKSRGRQKPIPLLLPSQLRRSPRFSSVSSAPAVNSRDGQNVGSEDDEVSRIRCRSSEDKEAKTRIGKKVKLNSDDTILRRSSRLRIDGSNLQLLALPDSRSKSAPKGVLSEKSLRSRMVLVYVGDEKGKSEKSSNKKKGGDLIANCIIKRSLNENQKSEKNTYKKSIGGRNSRSQRTDLALIELPQGSETVKLPEESPFSAERCLRSRSVKKELQQEMADTVASVKRVSCVKSRVKCFISPKMDPTLDERGNGQCDLELMSGKCLRSRKTQLEGNVEEIAKKSKDLVEGSNASKNQLGTVCNVYSRKREKIIICCFVGEPIPEGVAQKWWQWRYELKSKNKGQSRKLNADEEDEIILNVKCHYAQAKVGSCLLDIGDCVYVKGEGTKLHVGRVLEFFKTTDGEDYFRVQWFFRAEDTVLKDAASSHDKRRLFYSTLMNDNPLDCIISKVNVKKVSPTLCLKSKPIQSAAFYYDMEYCVDYSTFRNLNTEISTSNKPCSPDETPVYMTPLAAVLPNYESLKSELALLDLYSGCGGMSTGLCVGAKLCRTNLVTKWAVDFNSSACESLKLNHPETQVRNETADDFLDLLRQWEKLCKLYVCDSKGTTRCEPEDPAAAETHNTKLDGDDSSEEYEVSRFVDICYGDPSESGKRSLHLKVRWKGYSPDDDTWEPIEGLSNCQERIEDFVLRGFKSKILPLPGDADVICGGPPCQGISGYNRFRNFESPLADERNRQIKVFMDIVEFLKPKYVLMENVVDIIRFDKGSLGRYALSRLVHMKYQARLGTIASGCYGLPQFRLRVFIWGTHPNEVLPQFPLPTHDVVVKYWPPLEFERNIVAYDEGQPRPLEEAVVLRDSISDLPSVTNYENREEMAYEKPPETDFQTNIRLRRDEMFGIVSPISDSQTTLPVLHDHRPLQLSEHDYLRVRHIPHKKGANFRDFPGIIVGEDNVARRDPTKKAVMLPTGRPLIPESVFKFENGKSKRPYARLWWDETVSTVVTFPHIRVQAILHPEQDRCLTIRECARLQGFPDFYKFCGPITERYRQVGNAVSIPVARALGYALGMAFQRVVGDEPLMTLPPKFSSQRPPPSSCSD